MLGIALGVVQATAETSEQIWIDFNPSLWPSENVELFGDIGARTEIGDDAWWRFVLRPSIAAPIGAFRLTAGFGNFITVNNVIDDRWEVRPFQGISAVWPDRRLSLEHYVRLEERFDLNTSSWSSLNSLRLRYQLLATYRWSAIQADRTWSIVGIGEGFLKLAGEEGLQREQVRVTAGIQRDVRGGRSIRFELSWQQENLFFRRDQTIDEVFLRIRYFP